MEIYAYESKRPIGMKSFINEFYEMKSTKKSPELHGIGHQIVETTVKKYNGLIDYFEEADMFGVQIVLPDAPTSSEQQR